MNGSNGNTKLDDGYYLLHFCELLAVVEPSYRDLWPAELDRFVADFRAADEAVQRLCVRLLGRKHTIFRRDKLSYPDLGDLDQLLRTAQQLGFIEPVTDAPVAIWQDRFSLREWAALAAANPKQMPAQISKSPSRQALTRLLEAQPSQSLLSLWQQHNQTLWQLQVQHWFDVLQLLYFGNWHQSQAEFVLRDLELSVFASYELSHRTRVFKHWRQVDIAIELKTWEQQLESLRPDDLAGVNRVVNALARIEHTDLAGCPKLVRSVQELLLAAAKRLEQGRDWPAALAVYESIDLPPARERQARLQLKLSRPELALATCQAIAHAPRSDCEREFAEHFAYRVARSMTVGYAAKPHPYQPPQERLTLTQTLDEHGKCSPELAVAGHYRDRGQVYFVENHALLLVLTLFYWPVIFASVPGAFSHPFQRRPHDLYEPDFLRTRSSQLAAVDTVFASSSTFLDPEPLLARLNSVSGCANPLIGWHRDDENLLRLLLARVSAEQWAAIFKFLWGSLRERRKGMPDLILFPLDGGIEFIEVKGPGDRLQRHQRRWLAQLAALGLAHKVVHLDWA